MQPPALPRASPWQQVRALLLREHVLGLLTYVASVPDREGNALLGLTLFACALLWSVKDGLLLKVGRASSGIFLVESVLLYIGAVAVAKTLGLVVG